MCFPFLMYYNQQVESCRMFLLHYIFFYSKRALEVGKQFFCHHLQQSRESRRTKSWCWANEMQNFNKIHKINQNDAILWEIKSVKKLMCGKSNFNTPFCLLRWRVLERCSKNLIESFITFFVYFSFRQAQTPFIAATVEPTNHPVSEKESTCHNKLPHSSCNSDV